MAQAAGLLDQDQFSCTICLDLLKDPVTLHCGHSHCMGCIKGCWDQEDHTGVYSCPQCRETFTPRPVLGKNTILAELVEKLKKMGLQAAPPAHCYAGPGDVACDICTGKKRKAIKSCLVCLASYCETHFKLHNELNPGNTHNITDATGNLQDNICTRHKKLLEVYCRTEQQCICYACMMEEHRGHDVVPAATERTEKQKEVATAQSKLQQRIQDQERKLQDLRRVVQSLKVAVEDSERIFPELEQKIADLKSQNAKLEQLSHIEDPIHFLQSSKVLGVPPGPEARPHTAVSADVSLDSLRKCVSELKERLEDICTGEMPEVSETGESSQPRATAAKEEICPHCLEPINNKLKLMCSHAFCAICLKTCVNRLGRQCPVCLKEVKVLGDQPEGQMTATHMKDFLGKDCFCITYSIPRALQMEAHPNPGKPFDGIQTESWLPGEGNWLKGNRWVTLKGEEVLKLLEKAFEQKLIFTVAATDGAADRVDFTDIPHARNLFECSNHDFLANVIKALEAKYIC
ncbi:hypothetical protein GJAV_G00274320 [Gymnothorax javanicus]|nr:hypothetical protein GJAV_G00274320 [Gymnothorax javanicus]